MVSDTKPGLPRVGMLAIIRNRRAVVDSVEPYDGAGGRLHMVRLEYMDADGIQSDQILWEREVSTKLIEPAQLPRISQAGPMSGDNFDALQRAVRWTALSRFGVAEEGTCVPIAAPLFGSIQVEDYQLVPIAKALDMPRVSLLLADDVGLGKTVEAGMLLTELIVRRRIQRVLVLTPASLCSQWQQELLEKFALSSDLVDRASTYYLQKRLGLDANPWRTFPRIISSYHYLRQADVLEQFLSVCIGHMKHARMPWDLLIVDEAHNLTPSGFGDDSELAKMLRRIAPYFEHKLFLTATPHNGHTRSFTGLLEQLDPARFTQKSEFSQSEKDRIKQVVVRRLKHEIIEQDRRIGRIPRFSERHLTPLPLFLGSEEQRVSTAFREFRKAAARDRSDPASFAIEVLNKRLLSCPYSFADSWHRFREGVEQEEADQRVVIAARRAAEEEVIDEQEAEIRVRHAVKATGAWFKGLAEIHADRIGNVDAALMALGLSPGEDGDAKAPSSDARFDRLLDLIRQRLRIGDTWVEDERLVIFTEYKTTLDYVERRLREEFPDELRIRVLFGGLPEEVRDKVKQAFNDPNDPVRILVATDVASEGLNLQETARLLLHYDIPWNPARLDQRNGRLDRHGQARDVEVFHFTSDEDADLKFLSYVIGKVNSIREDLGSMGEVFDRAFERRFLDNIDASLIERGIEDGVRERKDRAEFEHDQDLGGEELSAVASFKDEIDLNPDTIRWTVETALGIKVGLPRLEDVGNGRYRLLQPLPARWENVLDDSVRINSGRELGPLRQLLFDPECLVEVRSGRPIFRSAKDTVLLHLGHPVVKLALATIARERFPGAADGPTQSRWTVRHGDLPSGAEALVLLTVEEMGVNLLREPFHHWVRTLRFPVADGTVGDLLPHVAAAKDRPAPTVLDASAIRRAQDIWDEVESEIADRLQKYSIVLNDEISAKMIDVRQAAQSDEKKRFTNRIAEVKQQMSETKINTIARERNKLIAEMMQGVLFDEDRRIAEERLKDLESELENRQRNLRGLLEYLENERDRVLDYVVPQRFALRGQVHVFPVTVEIRL